AGGQSPVRSTQAHRRARVRHDQVCAGHPQVSLARFEEGLGRVATNLLDAQPSEDLAPRLPRCGKLRGPVRAEGWAEADKAKAKRCRGNAEVHANTRTRS